MFAGSGAKNCFSKQEHAALLDLSKSLPVLREILIDLELAMTELKKAQPGSMDARDWEETLNALVREASSMASKLGLER